MSYTFKAWEELCWTVGVAAGIAVLTVLVDLDPLKIGDARTWLIALGGAAIRAAAGAAIAVLTRPRSEPPA